MHRCWQDLHSYPREEGCVAGCAAGDAGQVQGVHIKYTEYRVSHNRSPLFELLRAEKPGAWSRVAALTGDIEEDMLGLGPGELVTCSTAYLGVSRQEKKCPIRRLDVHRHLAVSQCNENNNANVGLRIIDIALPLLSLFSRITTRV